VPPVATIEAKIQQWKTFGGVEGGLQGLLIDSSFVIQTTRVVQPSWLPRLPVRRQGPEGDVSALLCANEHFKRMYAVQQEKPVNDETPLDKGYRGASC
jgi:hypothetical protein